VRRLERLQLPWTSYTAASCIKLHQRQEHQDIKQCLLPSTAVVKMILTHLVSCWVDSTSRGRVTDVDPPMLTRCQAVARIADRTA